MNVTRYQHVAVLLIKWADDLEETKTRDQVRILSAATRALWKSLTNQF